MFDTYPNTEDCTPQRRIPVQNELTATGIYMQAGHSAMYHKQGQLASALYAKVYLKPHSFVPSTMDPAQGSAGSTGIGQSDKGRSNHHPVVVLPSITPVISPRWCNSHS
ncbi:hypothetical protein BELL_0257g00050 [Botrytis elliptica]|uniref:Uncharacterized protein n=1 Tax=Botrytis elliptica TaxID=278938 RepID=A0A4Z1JM10_9HELO|nr:hypothetical protein EAE99_008386 [Botrytis elliptica]TGO74769.1 hypothetical protein BELL_0257g00050 [Botrytis elliptica]